MTPLLAGCGAGGIDAPGSEARGRELFTQKCGNCHTMAAAGTRGQIGPNLDDAFATVREEGFDVSTIREVVDEQIRFPVEDPPVGEGMPGPDVLFKDSDDRDADIVDVATFVANKAGTGATPPAGGGAAAGTDGKSIFTSNCGSCHTLAAAGTTGTIGPNLDEQQPSLELAVDRVTNGKGAMPAFKGQLSDAQIGAVSRYVSQNAGK